MTWANELNILRRYLRDPSQNIWSNDLLKGLYNQAQNELQQRTWLLEEVRNIQLPPEFAITYLHDWEWGQNSASNKYRGLRNQGGNYAFCFRWEAQEDFGLEADTSDEGIAYTHGWEAFIYSNPGLPPRIGLPANLHTIKGMYYDKEPLYPVAKKIIGYTDASWQQRVGEPLGYFIESDADNQFSLYGRPNSITWSDDNGTPTVTDSISSGSGRYIRLPGDPGSYVSTPDSNDLDITGDIDVRGVIELDDYAVGDSQTIAAKWESTGDERSWTLFYNATGLLVFTWSTDGTAGASTNESVLASNHTPANGQKYGVRVTMDVDNGSSDADVLWYLMDNPDADPTDDSNWTLVESDTVGSTTSINSGSALLEVGSLNTGDGDRAKGKIYRALVYDGISGTLVADCNPGETYSLTPSSFVSTTGEKYTLHGETYLEGPDGWRPDDDLGAVTQRTGSLLSSESGAAVDIVEDDDNIILHYRVSPTEINGLSDNPDFPPYLSKYIRYRTLAMAYSANTDGRIESLAQYWNDRAALGLQFVNKFKTNRFKDKDYRLATRENPARRTRKHPRLPDGYPAA